jgi:hypothetical protein
MVFQRRNKLKKIIVFLTLLAIPLLAQNNKGRISLTFNDEKFDIPITYERFDKEDKIRVAVRAENKDSLSTKWVSMEMAFDNFVKEKLDHPSEFKLQIQSDSSRGLISKRFVFNYGNKEIQFDYFKNGERLTLKEPFFQFHFDKFYAGFNGGSLIIEGTFWGSLDLDSGKIKAEIKEGKFEIIL